jgi:hypothetical protein
MPKKELIASYPQRVWAQDLATARGGTQVKEVLLCTEAPQKKPGFGEQPYLEVNLYDVTGKVPVRVFPERFKHCKLEPGQTVELEGELRRGDRSWWVVAKNIVEKPIEDVEMVTPVAFQPIETLESDLETFAGRVDPESVYWRILALFMDDHGDGGPDGECVEGEGGEKEVKGWRNKMRLAPRSDFFPLSYVGAALEETVTRTRIAITKCEADPDLKVGIMIAASILGGTGLLEVFERRNGMVVRARKGNADHEAFLARDSIRDRIKEHDQSLEEGEEPIDVDSKEVRAVIHCVVGLHGKRFLPEGKFGIREAKVLHDIGTVVRA